jgi:hypothetical protein
MAVKFFNRNIPDECHRVMTDFVAAGNDIASVAFAPGSGSHFSVVAKTELIVGRRLREVLNEAPFGGRLT